MKQLFLPLVALGMMVFATIHVVKGNQPQDKLAPPIPPTRNPFRASIAGTGIVEPASENIFIGSHLPGVVEEVFVKVGKKVKAGDKLFRLDDRQLKAELNTRQATRTGALATLDKLRHQPRPEELPPLVAKVREAEAMLSNARDLVSRSEKLIRTGAIGEEELIGRRNGVLSSEAQIARVRSELALAQAGAWKYDIEIALANIALAQANIEQTQTEVSRLIVTAPIDGTILQMNVRKGEYVGIPPGATLIIMGDISVEHIRVDIDENDIARFREGIPGKAFPRGSPEKEIPLTFVRIEYYVTPKKSLTGSNTERVDTRVLQAIYRIGDTKTPLFVGQQVDVALNSE